MRPILVLCPILALLAGCSGTKKPDVISNLNDRNNTVVQIRTLTTVAFAKIVADEPVDADDKANAEKALPMVKKVLEYSPNEPESYVLLGRTYWVLDRHKEAEGSFKQAVDIQRKYKTSSDALEAEAHHDWARLAISDGRWDEGGKEVDEALKLFPDDPRYLTTKASVQLQAKDVEGARVNAAKALKIDPQNSRALTMLKMIQAADKDGPAKA